MTDTVEETPETMPDVTDPRIRGIAIEAKLIEWNIPYTYDPAMPLAEISVLQAAQTRSEEHMVDQDQVEEFAEQMRNGAIFPPVLLQNERLLLDGNTRTGAARKNRLKTFPAYHAAFPNIELGRTFAASMNQENGRRLSKTEAHAAAISLLKFGHTEDSVARELGYSRTSIQNWKKEADFVLRASEALVADQAETISKNDQHKLADIRQRAPFAAAVDLVATVRPARSVVTALVKEVKDAPSESDAIRIIDEKRRELAPAGPPPHRPTIAKQLAIIRRTLPQILNQADNPSVLIETDPDKRADAMVQWERLHGLSEVVLGLYRA
jgi:hypothetical protein